MDIFIRETKSDYLKTTELYFMSRLVDCVDVRTMIEEFFEWCAYGSEDYESGTI